MPGASAKRRFIRLNRSGGWREKSLQGSRRQSPALKAMLRTLSPTMPRVQATMAPFQERDSESYFPNVTYPQKESATTSFQNSVKNIALSCARTTEGFRSVHLKAN